MQISNVTIAIIGLGYVGLPLAIEFGKKINVIGFDTNSKRIDQLNNGNDLTKETTSAEIKKAKKLSFTSDLNDIRKANCYIVTVPTPITDHKQPDLLPLLEASKMVGSCISKGDVIIYESTVYPGATEEECIPIIEKYSRLKFNVDFFCGYSPERINPGDKKHRLVNIMKVTSGSTEETAKFVDNLYKTIIKAGTHLAKNIKIAEAAKVIENTQRDLNIALVNELAIIFNKMNISTEDVLNAAGTKWNFLPFRPGLVGGHCIGVDPYYLTYKAQSIGFKPEIILAGRKTNDNMGSYIVSQLIKTMIKRSINIENSNVLIMGLTFKENCPDLRNTKVVDIYKELLEYKCIPDVFDPWADSSEADEEYKIKLEGKLHEKKYDAIIIAVAHNAFIEMGVEKVRSFLKPNLGILYDLKYIFDAKDVELRL